MNGQPAIDEQANRARQREHVLHAIEPADRDDHDVVGRDVELALEPFAVALARIEEAVVDAAAQAADAIASEHADEAQLIFGVRRQHARAGAQVVIEPALNASLGALADVPALDEQAREASRPDEAFDGRFGEDARVVGLGGVDRADERDAVPARDARRRAREREDAVGGVDDVVVGELVGEVRVVGRDVAVVGHVRQKRKARRAQHRTVKPIAHVRRDHVKCLLRAGEVDRQVQGGPE